MSLIKCSPVSSIWWEGGAGHIRLSRIGDVGLAVVELVGQGELFTVIATLEAESVQTINIINYQLFKVYTLRYQNQSNLLFLLAQVRLRHNRH